MRDPQVHYDGRKILFSYRKAGTDYYHLYEINVGRLGLRQLTSGRSTTTSRPICRTATSCLSPPAANAGSTAG